MQLLLIFHYSASTMYLHVSFAILIRIRNHASLLKICNNKRNRLAMKLDSNIHNRANNIIIHSKEKTQLQSRLLMQKKERSMRTIFIWVKNPHSQLATGGGDGVEDVGVEEDKVEEK